MENGVSENKVFIAKNVKSSIKIALNTFLIKHFIEQLVFLTVT
tara:strand:- start:10700 stop:10828 length:129 start_codon:yes stop_codon:yes gene_type:complete